MMKLPPPEEIEPFLFQPNWVVEVYFGNEWHDVKKGTYREIKELNQVTWIDSIDDLTVVAHEEEVVGWKLRIPEGKVVKFDERRL
jgi:hypothetical protein